MNHDRASQLHIREGTPTCDGGDRAWPTTSTATTPGALPAEAMPGQPGARAWHHQKLAGRDNPLFADDPSPAAQRRYRQRPPRARNTAGTALWTSLSPTESTATRQRPRRPSIPEEAGRASCGHCPRRCRPGVRDLENRFGQLRAAADQSARSVNEWSGQIHAQLVLSRETRRHIGSDSPRLPAIAFRPVRPLPVPRQGSGRPPAN